MLGPNLTLHLYTNTYFYVTHEQFLRTFSINYSTLSCQVFFGFSLKAGSCTD